MDRGAWWASPWARKELDMTERLTLSFLLFYFCVLLFRTILWKVPLASWKRWLRKLYKQACDGSTSLKLSLAGLIGWCLPSINHVPTCNRRWSWLLVNQWSGTEISGHNITQIICYIKYTVSATFTLYSSEALSTLILLCNSHHHPCLECFTFLNWNSGPIEH